jgi:hypothetical protein
MQLEKLTTGFWMARYKGRVIYTASGDIGMAIVVALNYKPTRKFRIMAPHYNGV